MGRKKKPDIPTTFENPPSPYGKDLGLEWVEDFPARKFGLPMLEGKSFRDIFIEFAMLFMDRTQIADALGLEIADLDRRCVAVFGASSTITIRNLRNLADKDARSLMRTLSEMGNSTATGIYANYIARLAQEETAKSGGIKVVVNVSTEEDEDD